MRPSGLRAARALRGITQEKLAQRSGVTRVLLSLAENGHVLLARHKEERVAKALGMERERVFDTSEGGTP